MKRHMRVMIVILMNLATSLALFLLLWLLTARPAEATTCDVPTTTHPTIQSAVDDAACDMVNLTAALYTENVVIGRNLTVQGQGMANTAVDGGGNDSVFIIQPNLVVTLAALTIRNGNAVGLPYSKGGGVNILTGTVATILDAAIVNNTAHLGAGLSNSGGQLTVVNSQIMSNSAAILGGGISGFPVRVIGSLIANNTAGSFGGGVYGQTVLEGSTVSNNTADYGGGIYAAGLTVTHSFIQGNTAENGGGVHSNQGTLNLAYTAVLSNSASEIGGGIVASSLTPANVLSATIRHSTFSGNQASDQGGALAIGIRVLTLSSSTLAGNHAQDGGAIAVTSSDAVVTVTQTTVSNNFAWNEGGGIYQSYGQLTLERTTVSGNEADFGGGISNSGSNLGVLSLINSTISLNEANDYSGGVNNFGLLTLTNTTVNGNTAGFGAGGIASGSPGTLNWSNSLVANNLSSGDCYASLIGINVNNLAEDGSCGAALSGDPMLGPLQDNGGSTWTHALLDGSPAVDAGDNAICPAVDQRGAPRPVDGDGDNVITCDIGAYEYGSTPPVQPGPLYLPIIMKP